VVVREDRPNRDPKEPGMYAVVVNVSISDVELAQGELREQVVPMVSQVPGFVSGVWMEYGEGKGHSVVVFEGEEAANAMAQQVRSAAMSVTVDDVSVHEVFAQA
jgi:hypothetical protein